MPVLHPNGSHIEKRKAADCMSSDPFPCRKRRLLRPSDGIVNDDASSAIDIYREDKRMAEEMDQYPPGEIERDWYYAGLRDSPFLIARTSSSPWVLRRVRGRPYKSFQPIADHQILLKWSQAVEQRIIQALRGCDWHFFWPIRIYDGQYDSSNVVLLIGVDGISLQWSLAIEKALACRNILTEANIRDVEVEMMDAFASQHVSFRQHFENQINEEHWRLNARRDQDLDYVAARINELVLPLHSSLGFPICQSSDMANSADNMDDPKGTPRGTMGLYLRLGADQKKTYGLISRHVALGKDRLDDSKDYKKALAGKVEFPMSWPLSATEFWTKLEVQNRSIEESNTAIEFRILKGKGTEALEASLVTAKKLISYSDGLIKAAKAAKEPESLLRPDERIIGHVAYSPALQVHPVQGQLRDWALLALKDSQFNSRPTNRVYVGGIGCNDGSALYHLDCPQLEKEWLFDVNDLGFIDISGVRPYTPGPRKPFPVGKRGQSTGLTVGVACEIEAIIRRPSIAGDEAICWCMPVIGSWKTDEAFSERGDSGACVFDFSGRAVSMIDGGLEAGELRRLGKIRTENKTSLPEKGAMGCSTPDSFLDLEELDSQLGRKKKFLKCTDVTFTTPMPWVLADIEDFTGQGVELA
ncbi:hypothetical protein HJFPF1_07583 [Paramyrothecium foliicola]|nr:hypothetical protein HJFPF1_07583 [Paramyrothecium foliicola]